MPGIQELLVIAVVALLVFGPDRLPEVARTAGRVVARFRSEAQRNVRDLRDLAELDALQRELHDVREELASGGPRGRRSSTARARPAPAAPPTPPAREGPAPSDPDAT